MTVFPLHLRLDHQENPNLGRSLLSEVSGAIAPAEQRFREFSDEARRMIDRAVSTAGQGGSLNLGVADLQRDAAALQRRAQAARELASATALAAKESGDYSQQARLQVAAMQAVATESEQAAAAARSHAAAQQQVQDVLNRQTSSLGSATGSLTHFSHANDNAAAGAASARQGMQQLGYQLGDVATMYALGARPAQIFASQIGQITQAVQLMGGGTSKFASFLGGPWGIALSVGAIALTPLIAKLFETEAATKDVEFASYAFGDAQSILGGVIDLTTGKINTQSKALLALAQAQAIAGQIEARREQAAARAAFTEIETYGTEIGGGPGGLTVNRTRSNAGDITEAFREGSLSVTEAERGLKSLMDTGQLTEQQYLDAASAVTRFGVAAENLNVFQDAEAALSGDASALEGFLQLPKPKKTRDTSAADAARAASNLERLATFGDGAAERIARVNEQFNEQPRLIDQAVRATRELDAIMAELSERQPVGWAGMIAQAEQAKDVIESALVRPVEQMIEQSERRLSLDAMLLAGRNEEAAAVQAVWRLEDQLGTEQELRVQQQSLLSAGRTEEAAILVRLLDQYSGLRDRAAETAAEEERRIGINERLAAQQQRYLSATQSVRSEIESIFAGNGNLANFGEIFRNLNAQVLTDQIFGDVLDGLDDSVKAQFSRAVDELEGGADRTTEALFDLSAAIGEAAATLRNPETFTQSSEPSASGLSPANSDGISGPADTIVVGADRLAGATRADRGINTLTPETYFERMAFAIVGPIAGELDEIFGDGFIAKMSGTFAGALSGYATAGNVGGFLGGAQGLISDFGGKLFGGGDFGNKLTGDLYDNLGKALGGAQTGQMVKGLAGSLGLNLSGTGSQLGGAVGAFLPIPGGDLIGAVVGGLFGKLFGSKKYGTASLSGVESISTSAKGSGRADGANALGGSVQEALKNIADTLDAEVGAFRVSIGTYKEDFRVSASGKTGKLSGGDVKNFGDDEAAAIAYALGDAIADGAIRGLTAAEERLLGAGNDIEAALQDVVDFRSVADRLKQIKDPVGAAVDDLDDEFEKLNDLFERAGASTQDWTNLEELYWLERDEIVKEAMSRSISQMRGFLNDLTVGNSAISLRERQSMAQAEYQPLADRVAAGDTSAYDDFVESARQLLDIERQLFGSQQGYFQRLDEVTGLTQNAVDGEKGVNFALNGDSPFGPRGAGPNQDAGVRDSVEMLRRDITGGTNSELAAIRQEMEANNRNLGTLIAQGRAPAQQYEASPFSYRIGAF